MDNQRINRECQARVEFLKNCMELDIIPAGCRVKPKIGGMFSREHIQKKTNQAKADSRRDLSTAVKDSSSLRTVNIFISNWNFLTQKLYQQDGKKT